ncbi:MAG: histidine kinase [Leadbetterella sp.]|nr:histidine kinase [Leadbetterella sp.]
MKELILGHRANTLSFQITPLDYAGHRKMTYQMLGYDDEPVEVSGISDIRYARMPPGRYRLKVLVDGNPEPAFLSVYIKQPFWQTSWFIAVSVLGLAGITVLITLLFGRWVRNNQLEKLRIMINSQEEERKRIAVDLHDDLGGRLSSLKMFMQATAKGISPEYKNAFRETTGLLDEAISELRNILFNLSPKTLDENGLEAALKDLAANVERITSLRIETTIDTHKIFIGKAVQYAVYRICQELINNTLKHSGASEAFISLVKREDELVLLYEDNGQGFEASEVKAGYGLTNLKTHALAIYSELTIDSSPGKGTAVTLIIPGHAISFEPSKKSGL